MASKIKWNRDAFREIRNLPAVKADLLRRARRIAAACGPEYEANPSEDSRTRARVYVQPATSRAARENASRNVIIANMDAGR